jgi:SAM-dependent methyltransferase
MCTMVDSGAWLPMPARFARAEGLVAEGTIGRPCSWLVLNADLLPAAGEVLDVACGSGRHTLYLAAAGYHVHGVDRDATRIAALRAVAVQHQLGLTAEVLDLEAGDVWLGEAAYDLVIVVHYLQRPLFPALAHALRPGGLLLYETFTVGHAACGKPTNPAFLLQHGELRRLVAPLEILRERDGEFEGRCVASVVARRPAPEPAADVEAAERGEGS